MASEFDDPPGPGSAAIGLYHNEPPDGESLFALFQRPAWQADAACREHPEIDWFPTMGNNLAVAKRVCAGCLVRNPCQQWAVPQGSQLHGIWGGLSQRERIQMKRSADKRKSACSPWPTAPLDAA